ncbi:RICIN domain-containing protein [Micromonospora endolithica]|uniref:Right-handed parallel beta-helix repeat-containing protein n=1 Tax=Micromonospora endolithica TaxID=230091 RepID=A0A3A9Z9W8_9ACTN|nr:ricin-type beta-trefoil lectin domain protein [Micromonospora endolithica]RKN45312.1 right-handed parallel beta-helix repeat-containing protein [Micromonospora endolithica]TWJ22995.1 ricin-type beta-trefoil lectin protein [Micromonospora endolithica]
MSVPSFRAARRRVLAGVAAAALAAVATATVVTAAATPALAATTTLYASPSGSGTSCSAAQPCSLTAAQTAVRAQAGSMSGDIVVQLADGVYRLTAPLRMTAADSGTNGYRVLWQAAPSARPVISGARAVTGWTLADAGRNIWRANVGAGLDSRQLYVNGAIATRARTQVNRADFTPDSNGMRFSSSALSYLNNLANKSRVQMESVNSFTDRYVSVQNITGNVITMQQPGWSNNNFGYDTFTSPHRAGPLYLTNAYEFLDVAGEWYLDPTTGALSYIPLAGQNMNSVSVELPTLQALVSVGGTYAAPAHHISFSGITFTGTSWLGASSNQGYVDQQTGSYIAGNWSWPSFTSCHNGCPQFEATRPNWQQMPAAVQVSAANDITFTDSAFVNLGQTALGIGNDANAHLSGVGLGTRNITVNRSEFARNSAGGILVGGVRADAHHPSDQRMVNRDVTISNNRLHDLGIEYRGIVSVLTTYVTNATISYNEVYNMPYTGMSIGYGWGANDAGGSDHYAGRGLYNYQPRYTTATTASNNRLIGNHVHDVMQQMNDGGCIYTLSANPGGLISDNYCLRTNGYFGVYFDEGSRYFTARNNVFSATGTWATANYWYAENMGNFTVTNNWSTNGSTNVTNGDRGNVVSGNVTVTNGNWPAGAQAVMAAAGPQSGDGNGQQNVQIVGGQSGRCLEIGNYSTTNGTQAQLWDCHGGTNQRWTHTAGRQLMVYGNKCLDASGQGTANGTLAIIWDCNGQPNQQWNVNPNGTITGVQSGLCLDASGNSTANGTKIHLWACHGGTNQQWSLRN